MLPITFSLALTLLGGLTQAPPSSAENPASDAPTSEAAPAGRLLPVPDTEPLVAWNGVQELTYSLPVDGAVTGGLWLTWIATETVLKKPLAPSTCRWCDRAADGTDTLNGFDAWGRGLAAPLAQQGTMDMLSNVVDYGLLPVAALGTQALLANGHGALAEAFPVDALLIVEATGAALLFNQVVKFAVGRERPFVHQLAEADKLLTKHPSDNNLSFFSGHSNFAFAAAVATGTVASLRGYKNAWLAWAVGLPIATAVPLLRMAADKHYLSDVLVGSAVGATFGYLVPTLFHGRKLVRLPGNVRLLPSRNGAVLSGVF